MYVKSFVELLSFMGMLGIRGLVYFYLAVNLSIKLNPYFHIDVITLW